MKATVNRRFFDDLFEAQALELGALLQVVQVHHISVVVLAVVVLQGFLAEVGRQGVECIRQGRQGMFHRDPFSGGWSHWKTQCDFRL